MCTFCFQILGQNVKLSLIFPLLSVLIFIKFIFVKSRVLNFHFFGKVFFVTFSYFPAVAPPLSTRAIKAQLSGGTIRVNLDNKTKVAEIYHCIVLENIEVLDLCVINKHSKSEKLLEKFGQTWKWSWGHGVRNGVAQGVGYEVSHEVGHVVSHGAGQKVGHEVSLSLQCQKVSRIA